MRTLIRNLALAVVLLAAVPAAAVAGTYTVQTCNGAGPFDGWSYEPSFYVGASADCSVGSNGGAPMFSAGAAKFSAPPDTSIVGIGGEFRANQQGGWQVGVYDFATSRWRYCGPGGSCQTYGSWFGFNATGFRSGQVGILQICGADSCSGPASFAIRSAAITIEDFTQPSLSVSGPGGWVRGTQTIGIDASDNVGVRTTDLFMDGRERNTADRPCDQTRVVPCPSGASRLNFDTTIAADGKRTLAVRVIDAAGNAVTIDRPIYVDNTAPGQIGAISVQGGDGWRTENKFALSWLTPSQSGVSPIAAVEYELCPVGAKRGDQTCRRSSRLASDFLRNDEARIGEQPGQLDGVEVPGVGEWTASVWLRDEAGNQNPDTAKSTTLRFDNTPPTAAFRPLDPTDPTRLRVAGGDGPSGIATTAIELQRRGEGAWRPLDVQTEDGGFAASLDDVNLPDGTYALRARAVDRAGNERSTDRFEDGKPAEVALPVRIKTRLAVGQPRRVRIAKRPRGSRRRFRTTLVTRPEVGYGGVVRLQGRLTTPGANPVGGTEVQVLERVQVPGATPRPIGTVTTSKTGRFSFKVAKGPSRTVSFRYAGTKTVRADVDEVDIRVRASSSFSVSRRSVVNGEAITFRGQLRGGNIPAEGKLVALQALSRGRWRPFATTRASARTGRWAYTYRFDGTRGKVRYRFRVRVLREATYPFTTGTSGRRRVLVRGI